MCSEAFLLQSQLDFQTFGLSQNGSKMVKWTFLRSKSSARPLLGPPRSDFGKNCCPSELKLKHVSEMCRNGIVLVIWRLGARPWRIHRISWNLRGISVDAASTPQRQGPLPGGRNQQASKAEGLNSAGSSGGRGTEACCLRPGTEGLTISRTLDR